MAYKSLYRKYRPQSFDEVFGQDIIIKTLKNSIKEDKISHAYLFSGTRGTGKTTVAKIFAKTINCLNIKNGKTCNQCLICKTINYDEIQDIIEIDAASNNGVDEIRELKSKINLVPTICKYKVYIIDEVHMLSTGAFNALLKTLEEPPQHAIFILATTEPQKVPSTILSRCQRYDFKKITPKNIKTRIEYIAKQEKIDIEESAIDEISKLCDGSMRDAIGILEQVSSYTNKEVKIKDIYDVTGTISNNEIVELIKNITSNNIEKLMDFIEQNKSSGKDFLKLAEDLMLFLRNVLLNKKAPKYFNKNTFYDKDLIDEVSKIISEKELLDILKEINLLLFDLKKTTNASIMFELFLFNCISKEKAIEKIENKKKESGIKEDEIIKETTKDQNKSSEAKIQIDEIKKILLNNTLYFANKDELKITKEKLKNVEKHLISKKYGLAASILIDSNINAVGENYALFTYKYQSMVSSHECEILKIESLIKEVCGKKMKTVALTVEDWEKLRPKYLQLKKEKKLVELKEKNIDKIMEKSKNDNAVEIALCDFGKELIEVEE